MGDNDRDDRALVGESMCVREKEGADKDTSLLLSLSINYTPPHLPPPSSPFILASR